MGKQNATLKSWINFVKKTRVDMSRKGKKVSYKDAMKEASKRKKQWKRGGAATSVSANAATVGGDNDSDAVADELDADALNDDAAADMVRASSGGKRRRRSTKRRRGGKCCAGGKKRRTRRRRR